MVPSGPSTPIGGAQSVAPSLLRSNSGMLGGQGGPMHSQSAFPSLVSPRNQYNNVNLLGTVPNVSSLLNQSFGNGVTNPGLLGCITGQRGGMDMGVEQDPLSGVGPGMGFNSCPPSFGLTNMVNAVSSVPAHGQGQQLSSPSATPMFIDQQQAQKIEPQNFQQSQQQVQQLSDPISNQPQHQQQPQYQSIRGGIGGVPVKMEPQVKMESQVSNNQHGPQQQQQQPNQHQHQQKHQQLQSSRGLGSIKLEPQSLQSMRNLPPVKMESQLPEQSMLLHQQQQQQQQLLQMSMSRQSSQAAAVAQINFLQQHRYLQMQQQHQQQLLKSLPQQSSQLQQQFQPQNLPIRSPVRPAYEVGTCARRLTQYMYQQQNRPKDNNIEFWRKFVSDNFAPNAKKKWCVSLYGNGRQTTGVFPQDVWHCEICNRKPGRGFEATVEVLPRLFKIKYESGTLEELLYVDMPREYHNPSGQIVLDYAKAIQESVFEQLRVVRDGHLRIVFSPDLKICSWEFCARRHEELIPRALLIPQVSQLGTAAQKYQTAAQSAPLNMSVSDLQSNCNMFVASARQLAKALEVPLVNDLGYTKRYVRCLQISEVVNSMKDLIDYSWVTGFGPMESLAKFPRRTNGPGFQGQQNQLSTDQQQLKLPHQQQGPPSQPPPMPQNSNNEPSSSSQARAAQLAPPSNGVPSVDTPLDTSSSPSLPPRSSIAGLLQQNSMNSRPPQNPMSSVSSPYASTSMPSPCSSVTLQQPPQSIHSPFQSPTPSSSNNPSQPQPPQLIQSNAMATTSTIPTTSHMSSVNSSANVSSMQNQPIHSIDGGDLSDTQSSVQKFIQEMMIPGSQLNCQGGGMIGVGSMGTEMKNGNGMILPLNSPTLNGPNCLVGNGPNNPIMPGAGFGGMGQAGMINGVRATMGNNPMAMNGRVGMGSMPRDQGGMGHHQQQDMGSQFLSGLGAVNCFNNLQFDWKSSP